MPDLSRVQSIIVSRPPESRVAIVVLSFGQTAELSGIRAFLRWVLDRCPSAATDAPRGELVLHPSMTWSGITKLVAGLDGLDVATGESQLEPQFCNPMPLSPASLGFVGSSAPEKWWDGGWTSPDVDMIVQVFATDDAALDQGLEDLRSEARGGGVSELLLDSFARGAMRGYLPRGGVLHFGYRDGISSPDVDWIGENPDRVNYREILLGYPNGDYAVCPTQPGEWQDFVRDASIGCVMWIEQHVHAFERFLEESATRVEGLAPPGLEKEWIASRLLGRWRDGTPVMVSPDAPGAVGEPDLDKFDFERDPDGGTCPLAAHIRVVHPRTDKLSAAVRAKFPKGPPRLIRRGFTYGDPATGTTEDGVGRGLVGIFYGARLNEQHRSLLRWMQETTFNDRFSRPPLSKSMQDGLCGIRTKLKVDNRYPLSSGGRDVEIGLSDFITYRGTLHAMTLSLPSLERLAR